MRLFGQETTREKRGQFQEMETDEGRDPGQRLDKRYFTMKSLILAQDERQLQA